MDRPRKRHGLKVVTRGSVIRLALLAAVIVGLLAIGHQTLIRMPGASHTGPLPTLTEAELSMAAELRLDITMLAGVIGERNRNVPRAYRAAAEHIEERLRQAGHHPRREPTPPESPTRSPGNIVVDIPGGANADEIVIVGAHYDSVIGSPGANDNASGVAAALALARRLTDARPARTLRFVFFADEEPPFFQRNEMGSLVYALGCRERGENIVAMTSLETMGWYSDEPGSQKYPAGLSAVYPDRGNFAGFVSNVRSRHLLREVITVFRETTAFPSEGGALPGYLAGVGWSDHWAFWQAGYPGIMITDTAVFRYPYYHTDEDTPDKIDFEHLARVTAGMLRVARHLARIDDPG